MALQEIAAILALTGVIAYAIFGGADFGSGIWSALARGPRAGQQRNALYKAIGPVWETNNVWLVLVIVVLLMAFPGAMADLFTALLVPLSVGLIGVVFRGAAFAFRNFARESGAGEAPVQGIVFSIASVIAPFAFGVALGATAGGEIKLDNGAVTSGLWAPWLRALPILFGVTAVAVCAYLTMSYMTTRSAGELRDDFQVRGLLAGVAVGLLAVITLAVSYWDARDFWDLWQRPAPLAMSGVALLAGLGSLVVLWRRWYALAPAATGGAMALLVAAWGVIQYPYFILPGEKIFDVASSDTMIRSALVGLLCGAVILIPSLLLLYLSFVAESAEEAPEG
ncbi:MAG TPA: cytochrome d ubiquinol oxidase subunit II [Dehalococcoidia bacterium]|nr:cytochrome d ubiquinol oxidase subunit II [Dehalococcoidia bacterium]